MSRLEAYVCGVAGEVVGEVVEISPTSHGRAFSGLELEDFPLLGRLVTYSKNSEFPVDFLREVEAELKALLFIQRQDSHSVGLLMSLLCLTQRAKAVARPLKVRFLEY